MSSKGELSVDPPQREYVFREYEKKHNLYERLTEEMVYIINKNIMKNNISISNIEFRVKDFDSFYNKIIDNNITKDPFEEVEDISGIRIICLYRPDLIKIQDIINKNFKVIKSDTSRTRSISFGYMSDHYIVMLPDKYKGPRYDDLKSLKCEIQVRTVSMHSWATVSHHLEYKQDIDIPSHLKNDFYALSGIFYIADSLFEIFNNARELAIKKMDKDVKKDKFNLESEINLDTLKAYLNWKLPERKQSSDWGMSNLRTLLINYGIDTYQKLDDVITKNLEWFTKHEEKHPPSSKIEVINGTRRSLSYEEGEERLFSNTGVVRKILENRV